MARVILLLLLLIAAGLAVALVFDRRGRSDTVIDRLRWAFVHGSLPAIYSRPASLADYVHPGGVRFRVPAGWVVEMVQGDRAIPAGAHGRGRHVQVEVVRLPGRGAAKDPSAAGALEGLTVEGERSVEVLPNGNALMKTLEVVRGEKSLIVSYAWRLARTSSPEGLQLAVFRIPMPAQAAADVIARSDLATMEREVREATFEDVPAAAT